MPAFDSNIIVYITLCKVLITCILGVLFYQNFKKKTIITTQWFVAIILLTGILLLFLLRLPIISYNQELNPDESWLIIGAKTLSINPEFYNAVNGDTSGPFNFYIITAFAELLNQPYDYTMVRLLGVFLLGSSFVLLFLSLKNLFNLQIASFVFLGICLFVGKMRFSEFVFYGSEHFPIFQLSILAYIFSCIDKVSPKFRSFLLLVSGVLAITLFLSKLQAVPSTAALLFGIWLKTLIMPNKFRQTIWLINGFLIAIVLVGYFFDKWGVLNEFYESYIQNNLTYQHATNHEDYLYIIKKAFVSRGSGMLWTFVSLLALFIVSTPLHAYINSPVAPTLLILSVFTIFAVFKTGHVFEHYMMFLLIPIGLLAAYSLHTLIRFELSEKIIYTSLCVFFFVIGLLIPSGNEYISDGNRHIKRSAISNIMEKYPIENKTLAVWGAGGTYYIENDMPQSLPWSHTVWGLYTDEIHHEMISKFSRAVEEKKPTFIIDTYTKDTSFFLNRKRFGYEKVAIVKNTINKGYVLVADTCQHRLFVRKDFVRN